VISASLKFRNGLVLAAAMIGIAACGGQMDDLDQYINEVKARPGGRI
jgi:Tfp pilus assembly protein PilP